MKKETLEEATERLNRFKDFEVPLIAGQDHIIDVANIAYKEGVKAGAKWQAERMYNETDVYIIWKAGQEYWKTSGESITLEELTNRLKNK